MVNKVQHYLHFLTVFGLTLHHKKKMYRNLEIYIYIYRSKDPVVDLNMYTLEGDRGGTVVKVLCYKSEGHWFDSGFCHMNFSLT